MVAVEKKIDDTKVMDLIFDAWKEKETTGIVSTKCPNCNDTIEIEIVGNSAKTKCSCGLMNRKLRGI